MSRILVAVLFLFASGSLSEAIQLQQVASLASPVGIVADGSGRLFILQQTGQIRILTARGSLLHRPFLNLSSEISCCGERGLLGLAFHPSFQQNRYFFVDYTRTNGDIVIARFKVSRKPNIALVNSGRTILVIPHSEFGNHNGGQLQFGPDGYLYIGAGDGGSGGDPHNNAQNLQSLLGKILRIDVDSNFPYSIPADNPFVSNASARPEIWAYGLRNPWRFTFDRQTGDLFIGDVGQNAIEEIDFQRKRSQPGKNYGWRRMEGRSCYDPVINCQINGLKLPILQYSHAEGRCSVTGGYRYRGTQIPSLVGTYLYADFCSGTIWGAKPKRGAGWATKVFLQTTHLISSFGEDSTGELCLADLNGAVYKIIR